MKTTAFLCVLLLLAGCRFDRARTNPHVRDLKTNWIIPGVTTRDKVLARLGYPPATPDGGGIGKNHLRWSLGDRRTATLEIGYIATPTFRIGETQRAEDILIEFDDAGIVQRVSRTRQTDGKMEIIEWREAPK